MVHACIQVAVLCRPAVPAHLERSALAPRAYESVVLHALDPVPPCCQLGIMVVDLGSTLWGSDRPQWVIVRSIAPRWVVARLPGKQASRVISERQYHYFATADMDP